MAAQSAGIVNLKRAPRGSHLVAHSRPPWVSIIDRQIERPIPTPLDFVVWKASKTRSTWSGSMPGPESRTDTRTPSVWVCSVLINNSRGPASTVLMASTAFRIKIKTTRSRRRFLDLITDPVDDISGSIGIAHGRVKRFPDFAKVWGLLV